MPILKNTTSEVIEVKINGGSTVFEPGEVKTVPVDFPEIEGLKEVKKKEEAKDKPTETAETAVVAGGAKRGRKPKV